MQQTSTPSHSPVDNPTYDLITALASKLEALQAYDTFARDGGPHAQIFERMAAEDARHADELLDALRRSLNGS
jgi:rubrerythrin